MSVDPRSAIQENLPPNSSCFLGLSELLLYSNQAFEHTIKSLSKPKPKPNFSMVADLELPIEATGNGDTENPQQSKPLCYQKPQYSKPSRLKTINGPKS
jgi:hypothetical protein